MSTPEEQEAALLVETTEAVKALRVLIEAKTESVKAQTEAYKKFGGLGETFLSSMMDGFLDGMADKRKGAPKTEGQAQ